MNKITAKTKVKENWHKIESLGWGTKTTDYAAVSAKLQDGLTPEGIVILRNFVYARQTELYKAIEKFEKKWRGLNISSDDGLSDVTAHIVGLGEKAFLRALANPKIIERRYNTKDGYKESFLYCFHNDEN